MASAKASGRHRESEGTSRRRGAPNLHSAAAFWGDGHTRGVSHWARPTRDPVQRASAEPHDPRAHGLDWQPTVGGSTGRPRVPQCIEGVGGRQPGGRGRAEAERAGPRPDHLPGAKWRTSSCQTESTQSGLEVKQQLLVMKDSNPDVERHILEFQSVLDCQTFGQKSARPIEVLQVFRKTRGRRCTILRRRRPTCRSAPFTKR